MPLDLADPGLRRDAVDLLSRAAAVDLHIDTFIATRLLGYDAAKRHQPPVRHFLGHVDRPRAREAGLKGALWSITTNPARPRRFRAATLKRNLDALRRQTAVDPEAAWVTNARAFDDAIAHRHHAVIPVVQGANALGQGTSFAEAGCGDVVSATLVHLTSSSLAETSTPLPGKRLWGPRGLTDRGRDVVASMNRERILVDLAHASSDTFWDTVAVADRSQPFAVTHTGVSAIHPHWRNIDDAQLKAVADVGGVVGVIFQPSFLGPRSEWHDSRSLVMRHLAHIIDVVGDDVAALGSDWDGFITPSADLRDVTCLPDLVAEMLARGMREERILKIVGGNFRRVLGALRPTAADVPPG